MVRVSSFRILRRQQKRKGNSFGYVDISQRNWLSFLFAQFIFFCGGKRTRTADICLAKAALYQLSYTPWAILDSNQGPHPYQGCALTNWANSPSWRERGANETWPRRGLGPKVPGLVVIHKLEMLSLVFKTFLSFLRRCSSHTFQYGYLVTTSPQSLTLP